MLDLAELAVSSFDELVKKRRELSDELAMLDTVLERLHQAHATGGPARPHVHTAGRSRG
jgi:hypothetical protein